MMENNYSNGQVTIPVERYEALILENAKLKEKFDQLISIERIDVSAYTSQASLQAKLNDSVLNSLVAEKLLNRPELGDAEWTMREDKEIWWGSAIVALGPKRAEPIDVGKPEE